MLLNTGPFGALMVNTNGEMLLPMVARDASGNATQITGALWSNASGGSAAVYVDSNGLPTQAIMGDFILLYSNWNTSAHTADIALIYTPTNYISVFKGISVEKISSHVAAKLRASNESNTSTDWCWPTCSSDAENSAQAVKAASEIIDTALCGGSIFCTVTTGTCLGFVAPACAGMIVGAASLVDGNEPWVQSASDVSDAMGVLGCASLDPLDCTTAALDVEGQIFDVMAATQNNSSALIATGDAYLTNATTPSGVVQNGSGLPSFPSTFQCTPGTYAPCYPDNLVTQCSANGVWGSCSAISPNLLVGTWAGTWTCTAPGILPVQSTVVVNATSNTEISGVYGWGQNAQIQAGSQSFDTGLTIDGSSYSFSFDDPAGRLFQFTLAGVQLSGYTPLNDCSVTMLKQ
jgi:hypothetical protein